MPPAPADGQFPTTEWTLVSRLRSREEAISHRALNELCTQYHYPLYCYIRRRGLEHHDAQDALHDFLAKLLRNESLRGLHDEDGRLRGFLCRALQRFLHNWFRDHARERVEISLEAEQELAAAEGRFLKERFTEADSPERVFERKWTRALLRHVMQRLADACAADGKTALFTTLRPAIEAGGTLRGGDGPRLAVELGMSDGALRVALTRLMEHYRALLLQEVRQTVERDEDVEAEIAHLMSVFQRN